MVKEYFLNYSVLVESLLAQFSRYESQTKFNQLACQSLERDVNDQSLRLARSCGSLSRQNVQYVDRDFNTLNPEFEFLAPVIRDVDSFLNKRTARLRIMRLLPKTCLSYHTDTVRSRWHIPLVTNENSFFVVEDNLFRMPKVGQVYTLRTDVKHTAINASFDKPRIHLVGSLV